MPRFLLLIATALGFLGGLMAPAFAADTCPALTVGAGQYCSCVIWNYGTQTDTKVTMTLTTLDGPQTCGPYTIPAGTSQLCEMKATIATLCGCKVTGNGATTRTSLVINNPDLTPLTAVACN